MTTNRGKYQELIDEQTWGFIKTTLDYFPDDTVDQSIEAQRSIYNAMCRSFNIGRPAGVKTCDYTIRIDNTQTIMAREYSLTDASPKAQVLYFHGGGFVVGDLDSHDEVCAEICAATGLLVTSIDYRLAPEHIYPAAFDDAFISYQQVSERYDLPVILAGDSAGANLAASVAHRGRQQVKHPEKAIGQLLIYPCLGGDVSRGSYLEHAEAPLLSSSDMLFYQGMITGGNSAVLSNPIFAPLVDTDFSGLPPTKIFTAQCDPIADDGSEYCKRILRSGGQVECVEEAGLVHGYLRARHTVARAEQSFQRIIQAINSFTTC